MRLSLAVAGLFVLGVAISAAYLFPGFLEQRYLKAENLVGGYFGYAGHYVYPFQFLSPFWGYGYAGIGPNDQMPYQLGAISVVLAICGLWALPQLGRTGRRRLLFFLAATGLVVFAMVSASQPLWDLFRPVVAFVQFPWRLLALTSLSLALAGGALATAVASRVDAGTALSSRLSPALVQTAWQGNAAPLLLLLALLAGYTYVAPQYTDSDVSLAKMIQFQLDTKELLGDTTWVTERPATSPMVPAYLAGQEPTRAVPDDPQATVEVLHSGGASYEAAITAPQATGVLFQIHYFPGWKVYLDGKLVETAIRAPQGLMAVAVPAGRHVVTLRFEDTPLRRASKIISLIGLATALGLLVVSRRTA